MSAVPGRPMGEVLPFESYPGIPPLFLDFVRGKSPFHPDLPTLDAAAQRGRELLGRLPRIPAEAFRTRDAAGRALAQELVAGRAVAVAAGHQVGLFTGPLFTLWKAFDTIRVAAELRRRGVPAVPVFWALTDDHDLEEVARTARPGANGPEILVLEGADRNNRSPVGARALPEGVEGILEAFRGDGRAPDAAETLRAFGERYAPGVSYGDAFIETLLDILAPDPLLILDPLSEAVRGPAADFFRIAAAREAEVRETLRAAEDRLRAGGREPAVTYRDGTFPFFEIRDGARRRVGDPRALDRGLTSGEARVSADVLTRPIFKSFLMPVAASILGPAEIAYHAQALPLFQALETPPPVLLPRSHLVLRGPAERRTARALGLSLEEVFRGDGADRSAPVPAAEALGRIDRETGARLLELTPELRSLDPTLLGALENARRKISYQLEQLEAKMRKAAERREETRLHRRSRLETLLNPKGTPAERLYPPLVPLLAHGRSCLATLRAAATGSLEGAVVVDLGGEAESAEGETHAG